MSSLDFEQDPTQRLVEIGAHLKEMRRQHAMSLEEISASTMIPTRLLNAIEEGNMDKLPEPVYTKGFIRRFADALGLNGENLAESFPIHSAHPLPSYQSGAGKLKAGLRPIHLYILYVLMIIAAGAGLSYVNRQAAQTLGGATPTPNPSQVQGQVQPVTPASSPTATGQTAAVTSKPASAAKPTKAPKSPTATAPTTTSAAASTPTAAAPVRVDLTLKQDAWVEIVVDGKTSYEGILAAKTNKTVTAKQKIVIHSGNAGGVMVSANKKPAKVMGEVGSLKSLVVDRNT